MSFKRFTALALSMIMMLAFVPSVSFAAETKSIIEALGGTVLWSAPDGSFNDTSVATAWKGWESNITSGYANIKTYSTGNTLQYYVNGTNNVTEVTSPGYGAGADKIILEWVMKRETANDLYFDFSFRDIDGNEIVFLKLDKNATAPGASHPENYEIYAMGFPESGTECAIVAYNNADGKTHTADFYVEGKVVYSQDSLEGVVNGFKSIVSSNGEWSTAWKHIGFSNLTIGYYNEVMIEEVFRSIDVPEKITKIYDEVEVKLPEAASVTTNLGRIIEADITWEKDEEIFPEGDSVVNGVATYTLNGVEQNQNVSMTVSVLPYTFELDMLNYCYKDKDNVQIDFPMNITGEFYLSYYFYAADMRNCWVYISKDGGLWSEGQIGLGTSSASTEEQGYFRAMVSDGDATLAKDKTYHMLVHGDVEKNVYSLTVIDYGTGAEIVRVTDRSFRKAADKINSMKLSVSGYGGVFYVLYPRVYYKTYEESKKEYTIITIKDGETKTATGFYTSADEITSEEIDGYEVTKTVDGDTVTFVYERVEPCSITFVNSEWEIIAEYEGEDNNAFTVEKEEIYFIDSTGKGAFYTIPETWVNSVAMTQTVYETENKYAAIEDAFVDQNKIYGINSTNSYGVMVASCDDSNRGPKYDANGETTYLEGASPTTLGRSRMGVVEFPVIDVAEDQKVYANFYVKSWHNQGFDGGNTYLKIAATPINSEFWSYVSEGSTCTASGYLFTLNYWNTPVFTGKCENKEGYIKLDITEVMKKAKSAKLSEITLKLQIYWGAAYIAEREACVKGGSYEGKASYIEVCERENLYTVESTGAAMLTKNGAVTSGACVAEESDDIRLVVEGAYAIASEEGTFYNNRKLDIKENMTFTDTYPLGFGLKMVSGAQVRYGGGVDENGKVGNGNGLRFITVVDRTDTLAGLENAVLGVIIQAEDSDGKTEVVADKWQSEDIFTTAITNLSVNNYNRNFTATPFVRVGDATFTGDSVTRSVYYVASGLLANDTDGTDYSDDALVSELLYKVLNAYVNQVGIRLTLKKTGLGKYEGTNGKYTSDAFFTVKDAKIEGDICYITLVPVGEKTIINTDYFAEYVRINNNNSAISKYTSLTENSDGTYLFALDTSALGLELERPKTLDELAPTYDGAVAALESANTYWQNYQSYDNWYGGTHPAFWDKAAYHTGNMEMYKLLGNEDYLQYTVNWAKNNNWSGNNSASDPSTWTWGYNQNQGSSAVLFGDWQICFQTYIDLYNLNEEGTVSIEGASVDRVLQVMGYQITKDEDSFWWWADALYMVMPVMTKLYKLTGDEGYLDALYKYFRYAKELMYDGEGGIPTDASGYTTSASLNSGAYYSDPDNYTNLFYRDAGYVYPLQPNSGHESEKNFWARGNGWVFAGLSKVLSDMPEDYEHYDEFLTTYLEMAEAIAACQAVDAYGYGFWTQSMLQGYPVSDTNPNGYETSGTAFFTYGLFWGINNGLLTDEKYEEAAIRGWGYLENVALQSNGMVGYGQYIGSKATVAMSVTDTQNYTVGAFLLAGCEAARWAENQ